MKLLTLPLAALSLGVLLGTVAPDADAAPKRRTATKSVRKAVRPALVALLPAAGAAQLFAAQNTHLGGYRCEFNQSLDVDPTPGNPGYVDVRYGSQRMTMKPVLSSTGALRLEDVTGRHLLLQIADKSMLMDVKAGRRLVDGCVHPAQRTFATTAPQNLLQNNAPTAAPAPVSVPGVAVVPGTPAAATAPTVAPLAAPAQPTQAPAVPAVSPQPFVESAVPVQAQ